MTKKVQKLNNEVPSYEPFKDCDMTFDNIIDEDGKEVNTERNTSSKLIH